MRQLKFKKDCFKGNKYLRKLVGNSWGTDLDAHSTRLLGLVGRQGKERGENINRKMNESN